VTNLKSLLTAEEELQKVVHSPHSGVVCIAGYYINRSCRICV